VRKYSEQALINRFVEAARSDQADNVFRLKRIVNQSCKSKKFADIEYTSQADIHWIIEAKSYDSKDRHNAIHKLFGELLKETGRNRSGSNLQYGVLLPAEGLEFFGKGFAAVPKKKFVAFGALIPVSKVFYVEESCIKHLNWAQIHGYKPTL
jgi:hypothetical protein